MLRAEHLSVAYGAHRALEDVSVHVEEGEICVILGANGAGKTTLLKTIAGLIHAAPGATVRIGEDELTTRDASRIVEAGIALVPEGRGIFADLTVGENLELGAYGRQARGRRTERLANVLRLFPRLGERRSQVVRTMSGGEQQMVAIGRALMSNPRILMLDEPSLGLSPLLSSELFRSLKDIRETGVGILLVEQNARQSLAIADRAYLIENGHITGEGRADALLHDPAVQKAYLGGAASTAHRPFGEDRIIAPLAAPAPATAAGMAERAAEIARLHVHNERHRLINGHASELFVTRFQSPEPIIVSNDANALSRKAAEMAARASEISTAYVATRRESAVALTSSLEVPGKKRKKDKKKVKKSKK